MDGAVRFKNGGVTWLFINPPTNAEIYSDPDIECGGYVPGFDDDDDDDDTFDPNPPEFLSQVLKTTMIDYCTQEVLNEVIENKSFIK